MKSLNLNPATPAPARPITLQPFALGFRPFFLCAAGWAAFGLLLWLLVYRGVFQRPLYFDPITWHAHEMVFGFTSAVIAGFLLTAAQNWTGHPTPKGKWLAALCGLWLAGRLAPLCPAIPNLLVMSLDLLFFPALIAALAPSLLKGKKHNAIFPLMLLGLTAANGMVHLQTIGITKSTAPLGLHLGVYLLLLMILVMSGRVFPFFTEKGIPGAVIKRWPMLDRIAIACFIVLAAAKLSAQPALAVKIIAGVTAIVHLIRLGTWWHRGVLLRPMIWVLHIGYAWIIVGFILMAFPVSPFAALHALTAGGIGVICLGMMTRVARGHTGRPIVADTWVIASFLLVNAAALLRVGGTLTGNEHYVRAITFSGAMWVGAFALFLLAHGKMLMQSRPDGKTG
jgi:uncharacterized protein involved in response to NO